MGGRSFFIEMLLEVLNFTTAPLFLNTSLSAHTDLGVSLQDAMTLHFDT